MFVILTFSVFCILIMLLYMKTKRPWNYPPGPPTMPFIGNLNLDLKDMVHTLRDCRKRYGDIFSLILGRETVVVICGRDKITEVLVKNGDKSSHRPCSFFYSELLTPHGIVGSNGIVWKKLRTALLLALHNKGLGKLQYEGSILKEVTVLHDRIKGKQGLPFDITDLIHASVSNVICSLCFGKRYEHENKDFQTLTKLIGDISSNPDVVGILTFLPFLKYLPIDLIGGHKLKRSFQALRDLCRQETINHKNSYQSDQIRDILDYLIKIQLEGDWKDFEMTDVMINEVIIELFAAGTETSSTSLRWFLLFMIKHQDVQERMRKEIIDHIGTNANINLQDRRKLPYCQAVILETLRLGTVAPFSLPHMAVDEIYIGDSIIPKEAYILPSLDSINNNEDEFHNPDEFDPQRFLDADDNLTNAKSISPFSIGRRICPGESLANKEIFLFSTNIVRSFKLLPDKEEDTNPGFSFGITYSPKPFLLKAVQLGPEI